MKEHKNVDHRSRQTIVRQEISDFEAQRIEKALYERHSQYLEEDERFEVKGFRSKTEVYTRVTLRNSDDSFYYPVECRIDLLSNSLPGPVAAQELLLDFQDYYFGRYLREDRDLYLPIDWSEVKFDNYTIQVRGQIFNLQLERMADLILSGELSPEEAEKILTEMRKKKKKGQ